MYVSGYDNCPYYFNWHIYLDWRGFMTRSKRRNVTNQLGDIFADIRQSRIDPNFQIRKSSNHITKMDGVDYDKLVDLNKVLQQLAMRHDNHPKAERANEFVDLIMLIAEISSSVWRLKQRIIDPKTGEVFEEMKKMSRPVEKIYSSLEDKGFKVIDRVNEKYISGMYERVITFEPTDQLTCEVIVETVKPTIYYQDKVIQQGEIIVGVPKSHEN